MQTILVCDDDKQIVEAIDIYLTGEGYQVVKAYDGYEVLEYLENNEADLLIIDVMMPGLDGIRTTGAGRNPYYLKGAGDQQHSHHHPLRQVRGHG